MAKKSYKEKKAEAIAFLENIRKNNFEEAIKVILQNLYETEHFWSEISNSIKSKDLVFLNNFLKFCNSDRLDFISKSLLNSIYYFKNDNYEKALSFLFEVNELKKDNLNALLFIGNNYYASKNHKKALEYYNKVIQLEPAYVRPYNGIGLVYADLKEFTKAIEYYKQGIKIGNDQYPALYSNMGKAYSDLKEFTEAREYFTKATQIDPDYLSKSKRPDLVYAWENYIWSCSDCNKGKLAKDEFLNPCNWADMEYLHFDFATGKYILKEEFRSDPQVLRKFESIQTSTLMNDSGRGKDRKKLFGEIQYSISEIKKIIGKIDTVQDADYRNCLLDSFKMQYNNLNENLNREEKAYWFLRKKIIRYICKRDRINLSDLFFESRRLARHFSI